MQTTDSAWKVLARQPDAKFYTRGYIEGLGWIGDITEGSQYGINSLSITRAAMKDALSVGNAISASAELTIATDQDIKKSAMIQLYEYVVQTVDGILKGVASVPIGTFFIASRAKDPVTGMMSLTCYDAMMRTNQPFEASNASESMVSAVTRIAKAIGVETDARNVIDSTLTIALPTDGSTMTMQEVLCQVAGVHAGNFIITKDNKLRLVPILDATKASMATDKADILGSIGKIQLGEAMTINAVSMEDMDSHTYTHTAGTTPDHPITLAIPQNRCATQAICDSLFQKYNGFVYQPYTVDNAVYDPAAEIGDYIVLPDGTGSALLSETAKYGMAFRGQIAAPLTAELTDEYPTKFTNASEAYRAAAAAKEAADAAQMQAGKAIRKVDIQYAKNTSQTTAPASGWQKDAPTWSEGTYIWMRTATTLSDGTVTYSTARCITGIKGDKGDTGATGPPGEDAVMLYIDSSNGNVFKNSSIATTLTVTIIKGKQTANSSAEMHKMLGNSARLVWKCRQAGEISFSELDASDSRLSDNGFILTLNTDDINERAVFNCDLYL